MAILLCLLEISSALVPDLLNLLLLAARLHRRRVGETLRSLLLYDEIKKAASIRLEDAYLQCANQTAPYLGGVHR